MSDLYGANVALLLHCEGSNGSTTFNDSSLNGRTPTIAGDAQISTAQAKFGSSSIRFDGNGDQLTYSLPAFGTGDFTIEGEVRPNSKVTNYPTIFRAHDGTNQLWFQADHNSFGQKFHFSNLVTDNNASTNFAYGTWYHFALVRLSGVIYTYIDGVLIGTMTSTTNYGAMTLNLGAGLTSVGGNGGTDTAFDGWLDEFRVTVGVARYSAAFTPPAAAFGDPDPQTLGFNGAKFGQASINFDPFTKLLLHFDGADGATATSDMSQAPVTPAFNGTAALSTANQKFGASSLLLPGTTGDNVTVADTPSLRLGTDDFCIEGQFYYNGPSSTGFSDYDCLFQLGAGGSGPGITLVFGDQGYSGALLFFIDGIAFSTGLGRSSASLRNAWAHIAVTRSANTYRLYVNGAMRVQFAYYNDLTSGFLKLGTWDGESGAVGPFAGYIDEFRILKGVSLYSQGIGSSFTPPAAAFQDPVHIQTGFNGAHFTQAAMAPVSLGFNGAKFGTGLAIGNRTFGQLTTANHASFEAGTYSAYFRQHGFRADKHHVPSSARVYARTFVQKGSKRTKFALATRINLSRPRSFRQQGFRATHFGVAAKL